MDLLWPLLILIGWFVLCGAVGKYAENKGRSGLVLYVGLLQGSVVLYYESLCDYSRTKGIRRWK
jgi:hypothetical protein